MNIATEQVTFTKNYAWIYFSSDTAWEIRLTGSLQPDCNEKLLGDMAKVEIIKYMLSFETHETPPTKDI